jgi:hypothetical protein
VLKIKKTLSERITDADDRGGRYLADANEAAERGDQKKAEMLYEKTNTGLIARTIFVKTIERFLSNGLKDGNLRGVGGQMASVL